MKALAFILLFSTAIVSCNGQDKKSKNPPPAAPEAKKYSQPQVQVKVNRKYDEKGNLIRFDSTYTYFYSNHGRDSARIGLDTVFQRFKSRFKTDFPPGWGNGFNDVFFNDSLSGYDFLNEDFMSRRFEMNMELMRQMLQYMDSLKTDYLKQPSRLPEPAKHSSTGKRTDL